VTFTLDTALPHISLTYPASGSSTSGESQLVRGSADTTDLPAITIKLFPGSTIGAQAPVEVLTVPAVNGSWSATVGGLSPGTYTVQAEQHDEAGNTGTSGPVTFTLTAPVATMPAHRPPIASFRWYPIAPHTGEPVLLVSSSTDTASPITAFAWALTSNGAFGVGKPVLTTSFATPGPHVVRLRVTDADGLSSVDAETITVTRQPLVLMQPFPIVRIAGSETAAGARITLLTVQAPVGARVRVSCYGRSCPAHSESRVAFSTKRKGRGTVQIAFRRFERSLRAGVLLEIRIYKDGQIGKYTRFVIRSRKLPERVDTCLGPTGTKPMVCPYR
jgi:hypothetical protein